MRQKKPHHFRLLVTISVLFTALIIVFGLFFRQFIYWQTSKILLEESDRYFSQINEELTLDFLATRKAVSQTVHILSRTEITSAVTLDERLRFVPMFHAALQEEPHLSGLQVGYGSGDFFIVRPINNDYMRKQFSAPAMAGIVVDNITSGADNKRYLQRLWYTDSLVEIDRSAPIAADYDPRIRPWYKAALTTSQEIGTAPYLFRFVRQMGLTIACRSPAVEAVIAGDVTLYHLSQTLAKYQETPRSELILLEKENDNYWVTAYKDPDKLIVKDEEGHSRTRARDLGSSIIKYAAVQPEVLNSFYKITFDGERWLGSTRKLNLPNRDNFYLVMLSPEKELLQEARRMQSQALNYMLIMILLSIPLTFLLAKKISTPMQLLAKETSRIGRFEFSDKEIGRSFIKEVDDLGQAMTMMESTIGKFISLISSLASEQDFGKLLRRITRETMIISKADAAFSYVVDESDNALKPGKVLTKEAGDLDSDILQFHDLLGDSELVRILKQGKRTVKPLETVVPDGRLSTKLGLPSAMVINLPLMNRQHEGIGVLCLIFAADRRIDSEDKSGRLAFIDALSGFAAVTLESRKMLRMQKDLLESFIKLLAGEIDSKSAYTGGHCQRVPVLTKLLARKTCEIAEGPFADFALSTAEWEEIHIASWLHDCGKVTTPEFVVDKATKLETIYDRIHEVRMRFEVLKRDAHVSYWESAAGGGDQEKLLEQLEKQWRQLDEEFAFVAECNLGGEFMEPEKVERLTEIAKRTWMRTFDDRLGVSWEEMQRKERTQAQPLPVEEHLLADREDHLFARSEKDQINKDNEYGFVLDVPENLYNRGELYNLSIARGTLTNEERHQINDHIVQTITMLKKLPYPKHLAGVPDIAGGHHEKLDGTGYPRRLTGEQMSLPAKMMVIADIFEALTASDRPYKKAKLLSEAVKIMGFMEKDKHIDSDLFKLFLTSGAYLEYANQYLLPDQVDEVNIGQYLDG
jgi:HD-GYP domain-containing protein (c-di-GMP phosphodiesterase class II)